MGVALEDTHPGLVGKGSGFSDKGQVQQELSSAGSLQAEV